MSKKRIVRIACGIALLMPAVGIASAQSPAPLRWEKTIPLPDVKGRIDHMAFDAEHQRLFVAALGNDSVEVVDVRSGKVVQAIGSLAEPQGVLYESRKGRLWIANGKDGTVRIFDARTFQPFRTVELGDDADNIRQYATSGQILVGYGSGGIATFDSDGNKVSDVKLDAHPESFQLEKRGSRIFVNLPRSQKVAVVDQAKRAVVASWTTGNASSNFPMALDETNERLFIVCRRPAVLLVLDTKSGAVVASLPTVGDSDDVFYDQERKRLYVSGGEGSIAVYRQQDRDHYSKVTQLETVKGARTSMFVPELSRFFLAVRQEGGKPAAIQVFDVEN
ncbi:YncE family protein [Edaphobacter bradus]|uniref:YncE family protein n=1 Tax=Edaphobacter bradus TaxID=2259016 RepID=UPI0021DFD987|nr:hypothetical protein [Edaphobacter bradus]